MIKLKCFLSVELAVFFYFCFLGDRGASRESSEYPRIVNSQGIYVNPDCTFQGWLKLKAGLVQWSELRALELWMQVIQRLTWENCWVFSPARSGPAGQSPPPCWWKLAGRNMCHSKGMAPPSHQGEKKTKPNSAILFGFCSLFPSSDKGEIISFSEVIFRFI